MLEYLNRNKNKNSTSSTSTTTASSSSTLPPISTASNEFCWNTNQKWPRRNNDLMSPGDFDFITDSPESTSSSMSSVRTGNFSYNSPESFTFDPYYAPNFNQDPVTSGNKNRMYPTNPLPPNYFSSFPPSGFNGANSNDSTPFDQIGSWDNSLYSSSRNDNKSNDGPFSSSTNKYSENSNMSNLHGRGKSILTHNSNNTALGRHQHYHHHHHQQHSNNAFTSRHSKKSSYYYSPTQQQSILEDFELSPSISSSSTSSQLDPSMMQSKIRHSSSSNFDGIDDYDSQLSLASASKSASSESKFHTTKNVTCPIQSTSFSMSNNNNNEITGEASGFNRYNHYSTHSDREEDDEKMRCETKLKNILRQSRYNHSSNVIVDSDNVDNSHEHLQEEQTAGVSTKVKSTREISLSSEKIIENDNDFHDKYLLLDCACEIQMEILNDEQNVNATPTLREGNLRIYLNRSNLISWVVFKDKDDFIFQTPVFCDLLRLFYRADLSLKQIIWHGISPKMNENKVLDSLDIEKFFMHRYTVKFPKTRIFIHATNVFLECTLAADKKISFKKFLELTGQNDNGNILGSFCQAN